jgi:hypothetical protein
LYTTNVKEGCPSFNFSPIGKVLNPICRFKWENK